MSLYPCELHKARTPGALAGLRVTVLDGQLRWTRRMRVCPDHLSEVRQVSLEKWPGVLDGDFSDGPALCTACERELDQRSSAAAGFAWLYPRGESPIELAATLCHKCADDLVAELGLKEQEGTAP